MNDIVSEYIAYLSKFVEINKPKMPKFDLYAYTDNEYLLIVKELNQDYDLIFDEDVYSDYLKGE
ncbi:MAG: hypothetical protein IKC49_01775 [Clostridia bacterium]|nr:hypothetical protein [Clostridia bacterium]